MNLAEFLNEEKNYYFGVVQMLKKSKDPESKGALRFYKSRLRTVKKLKKKILRRKATA